jgi:error-prone DNA polymerase
LSLLGVDATAHALSFYDDFLAQLAAKVNLVSSGNLRKQRSGAIVYVVGVKVAVQTPPVRSGNRVAFLTLEDSAGPIDLAFFEAVQQKYAQPIFNSWLVLAAGVVRKSGPNGISLRGLGAWELMQLHQIWLDGNLDQAITELTEQLQQQLTQERLEKQQRRSGTDRIRRKTGGMGPARRLLLHASGLAISPYSDVKPAGSASTELLTELEIVDGTAQLPTKLWHKSPGVGGR